MARAQKRDQLGRFAGGGGGKISSGLQARKKAVSAQVSNDVLSGKKVSPSRKGYARAQAAEAQRMTSPRGKGNKAARRASAAKAAKPAENSSLMARIEAARAAGRAKGKAMAAKSSSRNAALNRKAKALGG